MDKVDKDRVDLILSSEISLRDYFAGQALSGMSSCMDLNLRETGWKDLRDKLSEGLAIVAYEIADAMLKEGEK